MKAYNWRHYEGKWSYGIGNDTGPDGAHGEVFQEIEVPGKIEKGDLFIFAVWMQGEDRYTGKASLKIEFLDSDNQLLKSCQSETLSGKFNWTKVTVRGEAPEGAKQVAVKGVRENMATGKGFSFVWFDDGRLDCPVITASSTSGDAFVAKNVMKEGEWHSEHSDNQWLKIDLRRPKAFGGLSIKRGDDYPTSYDIDISPDGKTWETVHRETDGDGGLDRIIRNMLKTQYVRILCECTNTKNGFAIEEIDLKRWRDMSKHARLDTVRGLVGWENCRWKTFVGQDGSFAPDPHQFMISFWLL